MRLIVDGNSKCLWSVWVVSSARPRRSPSCVWMSFLEGFVEWLVNRNSIDHLQQFGNSLTVNTSPDKSEKKMRERKRIGVAAYIGIFSFLWDVPCQWVRILVSGILSGDTLFNFSNFDWVVCHKVGSTHSPSFGFILLSIGKVDWKLSSLFIFCILGLVKIRKALSRKGRWLVSESQLRFVISVSCVGLSYFLAS